MSQRLLVRAAPAQTHHTATRSTTKGCFRDFRVVDTLHTRTKDFNDLQQQSSRTFTHLGFSRHSQQQSSCLGVSEPPRPSVQNSLESRLQSQSLNVSVSQDPASRTTAWNRGRSLKVSMSQSLLGPAPSSRCRAPQCFGARASVREAELRSAWRRDGGLRRSSKVLDS